MYIDMKEERWGEPKGGVEGGRVVTTLGMGDQLITLRLTLYALKLKDDFLTK